MRKVLVKVATEYVENTWTDTLTHTLFETQASYSYFIGVSASKMRNLTQL